MNTNQPAKSIRTLFPWTVICFTLSFTTSIASAQPKKSPMNPSKTETRISHISQSTGPQGRCDPMNQEQTDLSGTYKGNVSYAGAGLRGEGELTIRGNSFTLTSGSITQSGRVTAVTTCGYTAITLMFGDLTPQPDGTPPPPLPIISLRAKKYGKQLTLMGVEGKAKAFRFQCPCRCGPPCDCCS